MSISQNPAYNLKAVLQETGIKADVLRAWERRYGLPMPQRTEGGHRLYSQRDIETIKWLIARQSEGLSISRAVDLWREMESNSRDPLAEARQADHGAAAALSGPPTSLDALRTEWIMACLAFKETSADQALNQAFALYPVETVCLELLQRGMSEIGSMWYEGRTTVQQEHFSSGLALRRLDALLAATPPPTRSQTVLVGCPPQEWHTFTALELSLFLRRRGLNVIYLGANVPENRFNDAVTAVQADLVVLVSQQLVTAASLQQVAAGLSAQRVTIGFGGRVFSLQPELVKNIAGHFLGDDLSSAIEKIEFLLTARPEFLQPVLPGADYVETLNGFLSKRSLIEAELDGSSKGLKIPLDYLYTAHQFMGDNIAAALRLGKMAYMDPEIDWLNVFLHRHNLPLSLVHRYLSLYADALRHHLGGHAIPVVTWLDGQIKASENS